MYMQPIAFLVGLSLAVFGVNAAPWGERANADFPDPNDDPFYHSPSNISSYKLGQVIRSREIPTAIAPIVSTAYQVLFRTTDNCGSAVGTVATIWVPALPASPPKILAYQYAEDADNLDCDPSWAWVLNSGSNSQASEREVQGPILVPWGIANGYYVVSTDAEGPSAQFLTGHMEGQAVLDALRATIAHEGLGASTRIALYGYSGGAHTSIWASTLAAHYAPELPIVGAAFGGTPVDLRAAADLDNNSTSSLVVGAALFGLANGYPKLNATLNSILTPAGKAIAQSFRARDNCTQAASSSPSAFDYNTIVKGGNLFANSVLSSVFSRESLLSNVSTIGVPVPKFPRLQFHGTSDNTVPYWAEAAYVSQQCAKGADIRFVPFVGLDHAPTSLAGFPGALLFVQEALSGTVASVKCGSAISMPAIDSQVSIDLLGATVAAELLIDYNSSL